MKNATLLLGLCSLAACTKPELLQPDPAPASLTVLKVDFLTHQFEGGKVFQLGTTAPAAGMPIPLTVCYQSPGDFGNVTLLYAPTGDTILDGGIVWMGKGSLRHPQLAPAAAFPAGTGSAPTPDSAGIQGIYPDAYARRFNDSMVAHAWAGIAGLDATQKLVAGNAVKGLFLYTPSVGIGNPADWDYFWLLYR